MSNENGDTTVRRAVDFESLDLYQRLGVERTASVVEINKSYKKLALQYHPDRNFGSAEAESAIKVINEAYEVLSDPNKRRQYDLSNGSLDSMNQIDSLDMANLGQLGRVFGAMAGKMGIPIPTSISQDTLTKAQEICQNEPGLCEDNKFLMPLKLGVTYSGNVNRQQGLFYLLRVSKEVSDLGLALRCRSSNKSRFKLVVFDSKGSVRYQEESIRSSGCTSCTIYFTPFEVGYLADRLPLSSSEDSVPPIFHRLSTFQLTQRRLEAGDHLVCVYGDNFLRGANFSLTAIAISPKTEIIQCAMQQADQALLTKREELQAFQSEYMETRKAWEEVQAKLQRHTESVDSMISQREAACDEFLRISLEECEPPEESARSVNVQQVMRSRERGPPNSFNKDSGEAGVLSYPDTAEMTWSQFSRSMGSLFGGKR